MRPETIACIAVASLLHLTTTAVNIFNKKIPFYTDSLSVVQHAENSHWYATKHIYENDMDVILEKNRLLKKIKVHLIPTHVQGHQDDKKDYNELTDQDKLNIRMDNLASKFLEDPPFNLTPQPYPLLFPAQQVCIKQYGNVLSANVQNELIIGGKRALIRHYFHRHFWNLGTSS